MYRYPIAQTTARRILGLTAVAIILLASTGQRAQAAPISVTIVGSLQSELGCATDFDPACATTHLVYDAGDEVWQGTFNLPAGSFTYFAALNDSFAETYGVNAATPGGLNPVSLNLLAPTTVKFYYDDKSHWVTDNQNSRIVVAPGSFQSELGCAADFDPSCLRSWLEDVDGDGIYQFVTSQLPAGDYQAKAAINESFGENYGLGGIANGSNIPFSVPFDNASMLFSFSTTTNILTITAQTSSVPEPATLSLVALGIAGLGFSRRRKLRS